MGDQTAKDLTTGLSADLDRLSQTLNALLDRIDGATITIQINLKGKPQS